MGKLLETQISTKTDSKKEIENLNRSITSKEIESVIKTS